MRRKDREVTEPAKIKEIIDAAEILRIGFYDNGEVYIVPVNFGYTEEDGSYTFYFHGAAAGRKYELSKNGCNVGFEMDSLTEIVINDKTPCLSSCLFHSVIGNGKVALITSSGEKQKALNILLNRFTGKAVHTFEEKELDIVAVYKLEAEKLSCKEKIKV